MDVWNIYLQMGKILQIEVLHCITDIIPCSSRAMALQLPFQIIRIYNCLSEFTTCVISAKQNIKPLAFPCSLNPASLFPYSVQPFFSTVKITHSSFLSEQNITVQIAEEMQHTLVCRKKWCSSGWAKLRGSRWRLGKDFLLTASPELLFQVLVPCQHPHVGPCSAAPVRAQLGGETSSETVRALSPGPGSVTDLWPWQLPWQAGEGERCELQPRSVTKNTGRGGVVHLVTPAVNRRVPMQKYTKHQEKIERSHHKWGLSTSGSRRAAPPHRAAGCTAQTPRASVTALSRPVVCLKTTWSQAIYCINPKIV